MSEQATHYRWDEIEIEALNKKLGRRFVTGDRLMLSQLFYEKDAYVPRHSHDNEQLTWVIEGLLRFTLGEDATQIDVHAGDVLRIPSGLLHDALALEQTFEVDIFAPPRRDWIEKTDDYLRR